MTKSIFRFHLNLKTALCSSDPNYVFCPYSKLTEEVRGAFKGIAKELYDNIYVSATEFEGIVIQLKNIDCVFPFDLKFLSNAKFTFNLKHKEPWSLSVETDDNFGVGWSVSAKTARLCVLAVIHEKRKQTMKSLIKLNKFPDTEDYTLCLHGMC
jgi:hypothetical protein